MYRKYYHFLDCTPVPQSYRCCPFWCRHRVRKTRKDNLPPAKTNMPRQETGEHPGARPALEAPDRGAGSWGAHSARTKVSALHTPNSPTFQTQSFRGPSKGHLRRVSALRRGVGPETEGRSQPDKQTRKLKKTLQWPDSVDPVKCKRGPGRSEHN